MEIVENVSIIILILEMVKIITVIILVMDA